VRVDFSAEALNVWILLPQC